MRQVLAITALLAAAGAPAAELPGQARAVLKSARCDKCHDSSVSADNSRALSIYDLAERDWPARLDDARLAKLLGRLKSAPAADQKIVREFVDAELSRRAAARR